MWLDEIEEILSEQYVVYPWQDDDVRIMARVIRELAGCAKELEEMASCMEEKRMLKNTSWAIRAYLASLSPEAKEVVEDE